MRSTVLPQVRVSVPLLETLSLDLDVGSSLTWGNRSVGQVAEGLTAGAQLRWARHGRKPDGSSRYWLIGPQFASGRDRSPAAPRNYAIRSLQLGYGVDAAMGRFRIVSEVSVSLAGDGEGFARIVISRSLR